MTAVSPDRIAQLLHERFATTPAVTWWDTNADHADNLDAIALALAQNGINLTVHRVQQNELTVKHRFYETIDDETTSSTRQLVYRVGERPELRDNWLLDIEVGYGLFTTDTASLLAHELGLEDRGVNDVISQHLNVFNAVARTDSVKTQLESIDAELSPSKLSDTLRAIMSAAVLGLRGPGCHRLNRLVESLLEDFAADRSDGSDALERMGLLDFFWEGCAQIYGFVSDRPTVAGLATWLFDQAWRHWPSTAKAAARIDFERIRSDRSHRELFVNLAEKAQVDLNIVEQLRATPPKLDDLVQQDVFPVVDRAVIALLTSEILGRTVTADQVASTVRARSATTWFEDHANTYYALTSASDCLARVDAFNASIPNPTEGIRRYIDDWCLIDTRYRQFRRRLVQAEDDLPEQLTGSVEQAYVDRYQRPLAQEWQDHVDQLPSWSIAAVAPLGQFAREDLPAKAKTLVIISDALRYEVALELAEAMNADEWFTATIEPRLAPLPSFTQLGMASHLPHKALALTNDATVRSDGKSTTGLANRSVFWESIGVAAVDYNAVIGMSSEELTEIWSTRDALVVYHDVIDATGDKYVSERSTPEACARAIDEITSLARKFGRGKTRASRVLITADHGFLYQSSELQPSDFLSEVAHGKEVVARNRRFVIGRGLVSSPAFRLWTSEQLGLEGDLEVQIPRALHRLKLPGAGVRYVHGGSTLQEVVVPLVTLVQSRKKETSKVEVDVNTSSPTITSSTVIVTLTQREAASGKRRGRTLSVAVRAADGTLLSNERTVDMDSPSDDVRQRLTTIELVLGDEAEAYNGQVVQVRVDEIAHGNRTPYKATSATMQRGFGGFFDPL